jgi:hypothetical protein
MKEKKQSANWYIAVTHYLTSGLAIPFVINLALGFPLVAIFAGNMLALQISIVLVGLLAIWLGVKYSAWYINKTYIVENFSKVVNISTIYFVVLKMGWTLLSMPKVINNNYLIQVLFAIINCVVFYLLSKKYLNNTEIISVSQ